MMRRTRSSVATNLVLLGTLGVASGCAATPTPPVVGQARTVLESRGSQNLRANRPQLFAEADQRMRRADEALADGDVETASLYAEQALQQIHLAETFVATDRTRAMASALEKELGASLARERAAQDDERITIVLDKADGSESSRLASRAIERAKEERLTSAAIERAVRSPKYDTGVRMLRAAVESFEKATYRESAEAADGAALAFAEARAVEAAAPLPLGKPKDAAKEELPVARLPPETEVKPPQPEPRKRVDPAKEAAVMDLARDALRRFDVDRIEAIERGDDKTCVSFRTGDAFRDLAEKRFAAGEPTAALEYIVRADERLKRCQPRPRAERTELEPVREPAPAPRESPRPPPVEAPRREPTAVNDIDAKAKKKALIAIELATEGRDAAVSARPVDPFTLRGVSLLKSAQRFFDQEVFDEAHKAAEKATESFGKTTPGAEKTKPDPKVDATPDPKAEPKSEAKTSARADGLRADVSAGKKPTVDVGAWQRAVEKIEMAAATGDAVARYGEAPARRTAMMRGDAALGVARAALSRKSYVEAERAADEALAIYRGVVDETSPAKPEATVTPPAPSAPSNDTVQSARSAVPKALAEPLPPVVVPERAVSARAEEYRRQTGESVDPVWKEAYASVFSALHARDEARRISPTKNETLAKIDASLAEAKTLWAAGDFARAAAVAKAAETMARPLMVDDAHGTAGSGTATEAEVDDKLRRAAILQSVCEEEDCKARNLLATVTAKESFAAARRNQSEKKLDAALVLANEAANQFQVALDSEKPGPKAETPEEKKTREGLRSSAEDALSEANIKKKLCEQKGCKSRDEEVWLRTTEGLVSAQVAMQDGRFDLAIDRAKKAKAGLESLLARAPVFELPQDAKGVTRQGQRLVVDPVLQFKKSSAVLETSSKASVDALAAAINANVKTIKRVALIGYTDSLGAVGLNKKLSADRAAALRDALVSRGVPAALLVSEGRGPESPIAENTTPQGRERNRRVEVVLDLEQGVE